MAAAPGRIPDPARRREFLVRLAALFLDEDVDPEDLADLHPEVHQALLALGAVETPYDTPAAEKDDVAGCLQGLKSPDEKVRVTSAQAIEFFVAQAEDCARAAAVALAALASALRDSSPRVRRAAAKSIEGLLADKYALPSQARKKVEQGLADEDEVVRKRVAKALRRVQASQQRGRRS